MAQLTVRHLEDDLKLHLKQRAQRHGHSMEEEVRQILRNALTEPAQPASGLGTRIASRFARVGLREDIPELRGQAARPLAFGK